MEPRLERELALLRRRYPDVVFVEAGRWIHLPSYALPNGWSETHTPIVFHVPVGYPATQPYAFCVPAALRCNDAVPTNSAAAQPPFPGAWLQLSWTSEAWQATADPATGSNLVQWVLGFSHRFREGA